MRCIGFLFVVGVVLADQTDDSSGLLQRTKKRRNVKTDPLSHADSGTCAAFGDPHYITFDRQMDKAHCYGPLGDYYMVKTNTLSVVLRYQGRQNRNSERNFMSAGIAVVQGVVITGSLVAESVIAIPSMDSINAGLRDPSILLPDDTIITHADMVCLPWAEWRKATCHAQRESLLKDWEDNHKIWDDDLKQVVNSTTPWKVTAGNAAYRDWNAYTCRREEYDKICPKKTQVGDATVHHGWAPIARVVAEPCENPTEEQQDNIDLCGHCKCFLNSWTVDIPGIATIVVNQGSNQGVAVTIHDRNSVATDTGHIFEGHCGNFNGNKTDDEYDKFNCPYQVPEPNGLPEQIVPTIEALETIPPSALMLGPNPDYGVITVEPECHRIAEYQVHCRETVSAADQLSCLTECCLTDDCLPPAEVVDPPPPDDDTVVDPLPPIDDEAVVVTIPCNFKDETEALMNKTCREQVENETHGDDADVSFLVKACVTDCCNEPDTCPLLGAGGEHVVCIWTNERGMKPFDNALEDHDVRFGHDDYWLMDSEALGVQARFTSSEAFWIPPALSAVAVTGYLLGEPRFLDDDVPATTWPLITVTNSSVVIDDEEYDGTSDVNTSCYRVKFGNQDRVLDVVALADPVVHSNSVKVTVIDCLRGHGELASILINNYGDGTQDVMIKVDPILTDVSAGYTQHALGGACGNNDGDQSNDNPSDSPPPGQSDSSLFTETHLTVGKPGTTLDDMQSASAPSHMCPHPADFKVCQMWGDPHFGTVFADDNEKFSTRGRFLNHFQMGLYRLFKSDVAGVEVQAFFCDARGYTTSVGGLAYRNNNKTVVWTRNPRSGPAYGRHIKRGKCIHNNCEESALQIKINGEVVKFGDMGLSSLDSVLGAPNKSSDGVGVEPHGDAWFNQNFFAQQMSLPSIHDRQLAVGPTCIGDVMNNVLIKSHVPKMAFVYEPVITIEIDGSLPLNEGGLCNVPKEMRNQVPTDEALNASESIFSVEELFELCGVCGMLEDGEASGTYTQFRTNTRDADGWLGCNPGAKVRPRNETEICADHQAAKAEVPEDWGPDHLYLKGSQKCSQRFHEDSAWLHDCIVEFCASDMDDIAAMIEDIVEEQQQEEQEHALAGLSGLVGRVWAWDQFDPAGPNAKGKYNPFHPKCCNLRDFPVNFSFPDPAGQFVDASINYASTKASLVSRWNRFQKFEEGNCRWIRKRDRFKQRFVAAWNGSIHIPRTGHYGFRVTGDDAAMLYIDGALVVDVNFCHAMKAKTNSIELSAGEHVINVQSCEAGGGWGIKVEWMVPSDDSNPNIFQEQGVAGGDFRVIEGSSFHHS